MAARKDSNQQVAAKERRAERRRCPECNRKDATRKYRDDWATWVECRWCGWHLVIWRIEMTDD